MQKKHRKWYRGFGLIYGTALAAFTVYVLLDTFVIPRSMTAVSASTTAVSSTVTAADSDQSTAESADTTDAAAASGNTSAADTSADASGSTSSSDSTAATTPVITDTSYDDGNVSISYTTERIDDTTCYIVDVQVSDVSYLQAALAGNTYGRNIKETTSDMAEEHGAILAINGDYYGFRDYGYVIRNGVLYRDTGGNDEDLVIDADGTMRIIREDEVSASELADQGVWQVLSFGPALVEDGAISVGENEEVDQAMTSNPRTAIGMISPLHYIIIVSDGRTDESKGLTLYELAEIFQEKGATVAYNLDGGGSSTLWFNGEVINNPTGGAHGSSERRVSDILYIGGSASGSSSSASSEAATGSDDTATDTGRSVKA